MIDFKKEELQKERIRDALLSDERPTTRPEVSRLTGLHKDRVANLMSTDPDLLRLIGKNKLQKRLEVLKHHQETRSDEVKPCTRSNWRKEIMEIERKLRNM